MVIKKPFFHGTEFKVEWVVTQNEWKTNDANFRACIL